MTTKFSLEVQRSDTIRNVKHKIREKQGALPYMQRLFFAAMLLESDSFADFNINVEEEFPLDIVLERIGMMKIFVKSRDHIWRDVPFGCP